MIYYIFLTVFTAIIIYLGFRIWKKTKQPAFILGLILFYYWSLAGSWFIIFDGLTNNSGQNFGLHYYHYCEVLFPIFLDKSYLLALTYYSLFIIVIELTILYFYKNVEVNQNKHYKPILINHNLVFLVCTFGVIVSCYLVWHEILIAANTKNSIYYITRHMQGKYFSIHQVINFGVVITLFAGLVAFLSKGKSNFIGTHASQTSKWYLIGYLFLIFFVEGYILMLGNKRELLFGGIFGLLLLYANYEETLKLKIKTMGYILLMTTIPMIFNNGFRAYTPSFLADPNLKFELKIKPVTYTEFTVKSSALSFLFSNEMFASHFSMYGIVSKDVPFMYGKSVYGLAYSIVPRVIAPNRPKDAYTYYTEQVGALEGEGFTIHHASGWYINFGIIGVILGAFIFAYIWVWIHNFQVKFFQYKNKFFQLLLILGPALATAQIPTMVRVGIEGYKAFFLEALIIPTVLIYCTSFFISKRKEEKSL